MNPKEFQVDESARYDITVNPANVRAIIEGLFDSIIKMKQQVEKVESYPALLLDADRIDDPETLEKGERGLKAVHFLERRIEENTRLINELMPIINPGAASEE